MRIYFVRHGESYGNATKTHQSAKTPLTEIGYSQAKIIAHRFKNIPVEVIYSSDYLRAYETAKLIGKVAGKKIIKEPLLREVKNPTEVEGKKYFSPEAQVIWNKIIGHRHKPGWHYSDEENYFDVFTRAKAFLDKMATSSQQEVLAVTHGTFLRMLILVMMYPDRDFSPKDFERLVVFLKTKNTGLTLAKFGDQGWQLITFNDHAHLG